MHEARHVHHARSSARDSSLFHVSFARCLRPSESSWVGRPWRGAGVGGSGCLRLTTAAGVRTGPRSAAEKCGAVRNTKSLGRHFQHRAYWILRFDELPATTALVSSPRLAGRWTTRAAVASGVRAAATPPQQPPRAPTSSRRTLGTCCICGTPRPAPATSHRGRGRGSMTGRP